MTINEAVNKVVSLARSEVGYKPTNGKYTKYAEYLDSITDFYNGKKNGYDWCDVWYDYLFVKSFGADIGRKMLYQPLKSTGAGCPFSAGFYRQNNAWSKLPQIGSQIFFGSSGDEYHTGIVIDFDSAYVYTIEGNAGGGNGQVQRKTYKRTSSLISGYGIPNWGLAAAVKEEKEDKKDIEAIAREVIAGKWGNGSARKKKLEQAGYNYNEVQKKVNYILTHKSIDIIVLEVLQGKWGNGEERKKKLEQAGYDYNKVQARVNKYLSEG